ncbi:MAG: hypothetical protein EOQ89_03420 [Mesorhizobium sp.]|nr:MAG: hypothetical protein EOQ89_03420 [Mesorhizobium sp.]
MIRYKDRKETKLVILHDSHTATGTAMDVPRWAALAHDNGLKMGLLAIGYHYIIERDGTVVSCRGREKIGTHTPGLNLESIGVCLVGGREYVELGPFDDYQQPHGVMGATDNFTPAQRHALLRLLHELRQAYPGIKVRGHTEVQRFRRAGHPACPPIDMDLLREDLELFAQGIVL